MLREMRRLARIYRWYAPFYDRLFAGLYHSARRRSIGAWELRSTDRVLIPCVGTGLDLAELPPQCVVTGIDTSPEMLARARRRTRVGCSLLLGDAQQLPLRSAAFDAAILHLALSVVPDPAATFSEVVRVLKLGGRIAIIDIIAPSGNLTRVRRLMNVAVRWTGTNIARSFDGMIAGQPVKVLSRGTALCGNYQVILLQRGTFTTSCPPGVVM